MNVTLGRTRLFINNCSLPLNALHISQNGNLPFNKFEFLVMWMFRECGAPYLFLHAVMNQDISWRTKKFR